MLVLIPSGFQKRLVKSNKRYPVPMEALICVAAQFPNKEKMILKCPTLFMKAAQSAMVIGPREKATGVCSREWGDV